MNNANSHDRNDFLDDSALEVTRLLGEAAEGDVSATERLLPLVYSQLRALAEQRMSMESPGHTLQATALVHEAFIRLVGPRDVSWANQGHFYAAAAEAMRQALATAKILPPSLPLVANVIAESVTDPEKIRHLLVEQVTGMVRWRESVLYMKSRGVSELVELGAGKVLSGLAKRIDGDLKASSVGTPAGVDEFVKGL